MQQDALGSSRVLICETAVPLRCVGKVKIPLESKQGNWPPSKDDVGNTGHILS